MSVRYWKMHRPNINLLDSLQYWKDFCLRCGSSTTRGTSIFRLYKNLDSATDELKLEQEDGVASQTPSIRISAYTPPHISSLSRLLAEAEPIPSIVIYDKTKALTNQDGGNHAALFHSFDRDKEKVYLIDPSLPSMRMPFIYDLGRFIEGWKVYRNLTFIVYPEDYSLSIKKTSGEHIEPLSNFFGGS